MRKPKFLCDEKVEFLTDFKKCEVCEKKETCINYNYEKEFISR
ncbi:MAG: hypothetical protein AABW67_04265 [Nanoarchaeota archaeon]